MVGEKTVTLVNGSVGAVRVTNIGRRMLGVVWAWALSRMWKGLTDRGKGGWERQLAGE